MPERTSGCCCRLIFSGTRLELGLTFAGSLFFCASTSYVDTAGGPQCLPSCTGVCAEQPTECRPGGRAVKSAAELDFLAVSDPSALRWYRYLPTSYENGSRYPAHKRQLDLMPFSEFVCLPYRTLAVEAMLDRSILQEDHSALWCSIVPLIYFGTIEWHQVDWVIPQFGGVQNRPHAALNIDFLHAKDGQGSDQFEQLFDVAQSADPDPTADFLQWWILAARRYLVPAYPFHHLPPDEIPVEATLRQSGPHPTRPDVPHVSDNRRPRRKMMVGTRTTARDWQWLDEMIAEDAPAK
ncbi:hypothetical protein PIB30_020219 [Stylosanthes scabra]|uniref:Uncharacterized protein n=1 Tax=Stylosanthes scabra TaxID=79078 RepID=A0ABU6S953_9FABA|nr:hypothetical protein [Stylosanthes scabra]